MKLINLKYQGFTLVEMAVVIVIVGLLIGSLLMPIAAQSDMRNYAAANKSMEEINDALIGFAMANGYLPCPAKSFSDGEENRIAAGSCAARVGYLPWATLGVPKLDSWGHLYRYSVTLAYANTTKVTISPLTARDITVRTRDSAGTLAALTTTNNLSPAVVISHGKNGAFGLSGDGVPKSYDSSTNVDERTNGTDDNEFISRTYTENKSAALGGEFDDVVRWISPNVYVAKMVQAGQLP